MSETPEPAGFGGCAGCAYVRTGTAAICFECAQRTIEALPDPRCWICDGVLSDGEHCGNPLCNDTVASRGRGVIYAIAMRSGTLERTISRYKYDAKKGWAWIFGRVLVGFLEDERLLEDWDLIIPMPTFVSPDGPRDWDHIDLVLKRALIEDPELPIRRDVMRKTAATPRLVGHGFRERAEIVEGYVGPSLEVIDPAAVKGKRVLVFDDVFTSGLTLREVAHKLRAAGAKSVAGIVLARQPFRGG